ncbi:MAG TPA: hypothetical protein VGA04_14045 [Streptosporangiaceae bacterium]
MHDPTAPYSERRRLADIIGDARAALDEGPRRSDGLYATARYAGRIEAILSAVCDRAEAVTGQANVSDLAVRKVPPGGGNLTPRSDSGNAAKAKSAGRLPISGLGAAS